MRLAPGLSLPPGFRGAGEIIAPAVADQSVPFGRLTLAGAGGIAPTNTGGSATWSINTDDATNPGHWDIDASTGRLTPSAVGAGSLVASYTLVVAATNAGGSDTATLTINTEANTYSARSSTEISSIMALGAVTVSGSTIKLRSGSYSFDASAFQNRAFTSAVVITPHDGAIPQFSTIDIRNSDFITIDGITFPTGFGLVRDTSSNIVIQNNHIFGATIDPEGDYSAAPPPNMSNGIQSVTLPGPTSVSILNNEIHDTSVGVNITCTGGALRIEGNYIHDVYEDAIKLSHGNGPPTSTSIKDNVLIGLIANGADFDNPHPDYIQFQGGGSNWPAIEIDRNTIINVHARAGAQSIFLDDTNAGFFYTAVIRGNLVVSGAAAGIRVRQASANEVYGNTVVANLLLGIGSTPAISIGDNTTSGTHIVANNVAEAITVAGTPTLSNNHALGAGGATIAYSTAFAGSTFDPDTVAEARVEFSMELLGPLDADSSGGPSVGDAGAVGSGYVTWATTIPGNDGSLDASYEPA